jgi:tetratricopeptide (TPR) repeat protein
LIQATKLLILHATFSFAFTSIILQLQKLKQKMQNLVIIALTLLLMPALYAQDLKQALQLVEQKKYAEAKKIFTAIAEDHQDYAEAQFQLGKMAFIDKKYDEAADFFDEAIDSNEKIADYHYWLGAAYGSEAQQANMLRQGFLAPKIKKAFEKCVALNPKHIDGLSGLAQYYLQAPSIAGGDINKALACAKNMKAIDKEKGAILLGQIYTKQGKTAEAEKEYEDLLAAKPNDPATLVAVGTAYVTLKKYQKALDLYEGFLKQQPTQMLINYQVGKVASISGIALERGEACLKSYLNHKPQANEPSIGGAYFRLGMIQEKKGNKTEAKKLYEIAIKLDSKLNEAKEALKRVS